MKSVLFLNPLFHPNIGGVENSIYFLSHQFSESGYHPVIITSNINNVSHDRLPEYEDNNNIAIYRYKGSFRFFAPMLRILAAANKIKKVYRHWNFDYVISRNSETTVAARLAGLKNICFIPPAISKEQARANQVGPTIRECAKVSFEHYLQVIACRCARRIFVFSSPMLKGIISISPRSKYPHLLRPGVDTKRFYPPAEDEKIKLRKSLNIPKDKKLFLLLGRLVPLKNFELAIDMAKHFEEDEHLLIVGNGPSDQALWQRVKKNNLCQKVSILKATSKPELYYKASDAFLMLSKYESFGQTLLEATASGLPVVALDPTTGADTATTDIYGKYPRLAALSSSLNPQDLADLSRKSLINEDYIFEKQRQAFVNEFSWANTFWSIKNV